MCNSTLSQKWVSLQILNQNNKHKFNLFSEILFGQHEVFSWAPNGMLTKEVHVNVGVI